MRQPIIKLNAGKENASTEGYLLLLFDFLDNYLSDFPNQLFNVLKGANENTISTNLRRHLQYYSRIQNYDFDFESESPQKPELAQREKRVDMGVNLFVKDRTPNAIFCIEAKRLPIPSGDRLAQEYICGREGKNEGGIERFKKCLHGKDWNGKLLPQNGMFGYIEKHDFNHWHTEINNWIGEMAVNNSTEWSNTESLQMISSTKIAKLQSTHTRSSTEPKDKNVALLHYWIMIN